MTYTKNTWVDQEGQVRYTETEDDGYKIFTANYEEVTQLGTPVNADNLNHIEDGIYDCDTAISGLGTRVTSLETNKISAELSTGTTGYIKFSNNLIIQWGYVGGMGNGSSVTVTLPTAFTQGNYSVAGSASYDQSSGDKRSTWSAYDLNTSYFKIKSRFEQHGGNTIWWIAIGS